MTDTEDRRICPHCGLCDVPMLVVYRSSSADGGIGWRCRSCHGGWTDREVRLLRAS